jgi:hypothetical protein
MIRSANVYGCNWVENECFSVPMAGLSPQVSVEHVGSDDFLVASLPVLVSNIRHEGVVDTCAYHSCQRMVVSLQFEAQQATYRVGAKRLTQETAHGRGRVPGPCRYVDDHCITERSQHAVSSLDWSSKGISYRFAASSRNFLCSAMRFLSGNEIP